MFHLLKGGVLKNLCTYFKITALLINPFLIRREDLSPGAPPLSDAPSISVASSGFHAHCPQGTDPSFLREASLNRTGVLSVSKKNWGGQDDFWVAIDNICYSILYISSLTTLQKYDHYP